MKLIRNFVVFGILVFIVTSYFLFSYDSYKKESSYNESDTETETCSITVDSKSTYSEFDTLAYVIFKIPMSNRVYELELTLDNGDHIFERVSAEAFYKYQEGDTIELHKEGNYFVSDDNEISIYVQ